MYRILLLLLLLAPSIQAELRDVSDQLTPFLQEHDVPSLATAVIVDGKIVAHGAAGIRKRGADVTVEIDDKYHIGSCTKAMTATLAALFVKEGKIAWDTTVSDIFRGIKIHPDFQKATLKQLLSNTGGCPKDVPRRLWSELWRMKGAPRLHRMKLVRGILAEEPVYIPGEGHEYSNAGFSIAGAMLEIVGKSSYETLLRQKLFDPLEMETAGFRAPARNGKIDQPYGHNPDPVDPEPAGDNPTAIAPAGLVHCNMVDWAKFAQLHLGTSPNQLLTEEELEFLHTIVAKEDWYALGWGVGTRRWAWGPVLTHSGSNTMFRAVIWLAPKRKFGVVVATNTGEEHAPKALDEVAQKMIAEFLTDQ